MTVRVGCNLIYEVTGSASLLLNLRLAPDTCRSVHCEALVLGEGLEAEPFIDSHGNQVSRVTLNPGTNSVRHDAIVSVSSKPDNFGLVPGTPDDVRNLSLELFRYTLPSRYCESDKLADFAWKTFGHIEHGWPRVQAISRWIHNNIEYRYLSGCAELSAWDVLHRGYGVCRDFAHLAVALNRTFNLPTRYVTGHLPDIGYPSPPEKMDFHAYAEVYLAGTWFVTDARFDTPRIGRIRISRGQDAIDSAFSTIYGAASLSYFQVWAYQIVPGTVGVGDPIDFSKRIDNDWIVRTNPPQSR